MKKILPILIALMLAAVASYGIANWSTGLSGGWAGKPYVAATRLIRPGEVLRAGDLSDQGWLEYQSGEGATALDFVLADFVDPGNISQLLGREVDEEIKLGDPVLFSSLRPAQRESFRMDWKAKIPEGKRAVAIPVTGINSVNGLVQVGDHVDVLVTIMVPSEEGDAPERNVSVPVQMGDSIQSINVPMGRGEQQGEPMSFFLLQNVEILSVGTTTFRMDEIDAEDPLADLVRNQSGGQGVTVALEPNEALMVAFANSGGGAEFTLALRTPGDVELHDTINEAPADYDQLLLMVGANR